MNIDQKKYLLTKEGISKLKEELNHLINVKRPEVIKSIQEAREQGDLSENADYDAAKNTQHEIEKRIEEIHEILNYAEIIKTKKSDELKVKVGSTVTIYDSSERKESEYEIVGEVEADPDHNKISNLSPLAKAILNKTVGTQVEIHGVEEPYKIKILKITY
ncbi:MAG: transcription elongation factor GreA [Mycoplasmataceae bacterium]|jgi:transcription elongation factor GreA|nr:transcription elongation factor GreA [Mycoplasmataceae bacterium]